jgi:hypothetical protein
MIAKEEEKLTLFEIKVFISFQTKNFNIIYRFIEKSVQNLNKDLIFISNRFNCKSNKMNQNDGPFVSIIVIVRVIEQPARSEVRFRYECEGRSAGPIPGVSSSPTCATYPAIQVFNYSGVRAMVMVSCVTVSSPYRQHSHHLVGRVGCHNGIYTMIIDNNDHICTFTHLGIQCAKRNEIYSKLKQRKHPNRFDKCRQISYSLLNS